MDTTEIMHLALEMAGMTKVPGDSGIWRPGRGIKRVLFSIDAGAPELLVAKQMGYDLLIAHHPVGPARLTFSEVVRRHVEFMVEKGVPKKEALEATKALTERIEVRAHPANYLHEVDVAKMIGMPFMNIHLPIDQVTRDFLLKEIERLDSRTLGELVSGLGRIPEFRKAKTRIEVRMGKASNRVGKWVLVFAAGTNGGYPVAKAYFKNGVNTVIYLHVDADELLKLRNDASGNLVVLGHMAGDSIGINLFLKRLRREGVETTTFGVVS